MTFGEIFINNAAIKTGAKKPWISPKSNKNAAIMDRFKNGDAIQLDCSIMESFADSVKLIPKVCQIAKSRTILKNSAAPETVKKLEQ